MESTATANKGLCSIEIGLDGVAFAYAPNPLEPNVTICDFYPYQNNSRFDHNQLKGTLSNIVSQHDLKKSLCNWVLHPDHYRLTLLNTPSVPPSEYKNAARWQIKDIINYPLEDVTVDVFYPDEIEKKPKKIYVIAAQHSFLQKVVDVIEDCGLYPTAIDIREFAIRNLTASLTPENEPLGFLDISNEYCLVALIKNRNIQFVRRIPIHLKSIREDHSTLITELERSFNYCEKELNQAIPNKFFTPPIVNDDQQIIRSIAGSMNKEVSIIPLQKIINFKNPLNQQAESHCWVAAGGVLRNIM